MINKNTVVTSFLLSKTFFSVSSSKCKLLKYFWLQQTLGLTLYFKSFFIVCKAFLYHRSESLDTLYS